MPFMNSFILDGRWSLSNWHAYTKALVFAEAEPTEEVKN